MPPKRCIEKLGVYAFCLNKGKKFQPADIVALSSEPDIDSKNKSHKEIHVGRKGKNIESITGKNIVLLLTNNCISYFLLIALNKDWCLCHSQSAEG